MPPDKLDYKELVKNPTKVTSRMTIPQLAVLLEELKKITGTSGLKVPNNPGEFATKFSDGRWQMAKHLEILSSWLEDVAAGKRKRILVSMPPRHGKSELISHWFPLWVLSKYPKHKIILASYEAEFAAHWGRRARNAIIEFGDKVGLGLVAGSTAAHRWETTAGGSMMTAGVGGPLTGKGANILIIDDPIKNSEEASSEVIREKHWDWFQTTAYSRLEPGGGVVVVATRWHQDDLIGRLEAASLNGTGLKWDVLKLPAIAEMDDPMGRAPGDALWPDRYDTAALLDIKSGAKPFHWSALYQQRPTPEEGGSIKRAWWKYYDVPPAEFDQLIQSWDLPFKDLAESDYAVGQIWGRKGALFYLLHQVRGHMNTPEVVDSIRNLARIYPKAQAKVIEDAANGPAVMQILQHEVGGLIPWPPKGQRKMNKDQRVSAVEPLIQAGNVFLPGIKKAEDRWEPAGRWVAEFIEECAAFPNGTNDDQIDAMTQALIYMQPAGWLTIQKAHREALKGPPPKTNDDFLHREFSKSVHKELKKAEKRLNSMVGSAFRPKNRHRGW